MEREKDELKRELQEKQITLEESTIRVVCGHSALLMSVAVQDRQELETQLMELGLEREQLEEDLQTATLSFEKLHKEFLQVPLSLPLFPLLPVLPLTTCAEAAEL